MAKSISLPTVRGGARILTVGAYRPERVVDNAEICEQIDSSDEWIRAHSGIVSRRWAAAEQSVTDMAEAAARVAVTRAGLDGSQLDAVIVATITHPYQVPSAAAALAHRLGSTAGAFDVSAACSGFCTALELAANLVRSGGAKFVLAVGVEKLSDFTNPTDRASAFLFADGAGAAVVGPSDDPGIGPVVWGSDGSRWRAISNSHSWTDLHTQSELGWPYLTMEGPEVFRWAITKMPVVANQALASAGVSATDLAAFIPHQANLLIIDKIAKRMRLPETVVVARDIVETGNTSAASVPLAMDSLLAEQPGLSGGLALLIGFGAGLTYAAQVVTLP